MFKKKKTEVVNAIPETNEQSNKDIDLVKRYQQNKGFFEADVMNQLLILSVQLESLNDTLKKAIENEG